MGDSRFPADWSEILQHQWEGFAGASEAGEEVTFNEMADGVGRYCQLQQGEKLIVWTPETGAHALYGGIGAKWRELGWERGPLGYPTTDEIDCPDRARIQYFQRGVVYWHPKHNAFEIHGGIYRHWLALGGERFGYPCSDEQEMADGVGRYSEFDWGNKLIVWTPRTRAHALYGGIGAKWRELGWERGPLGYPTTDEIDCPDRARIQYFQRGAVYWYPEQGVFEMHGGIYGHWLALGGERFGYPCSDEQEMADGVGRYSEFDWSNKLIVWTPETEAHALYGGIGEKWRELGWERGPLGYPTTDEEFGPEDSMIQRFQRGSIVWWEDVGAVHLGEIVIRLTDIGPVGGTSSALAEPNVDLTLKDIDTSLLRGVPVATLPAEIYRGVPRDIPLGFQMTESSESVDKKVLLALKAAQQTGAAAITVVPFGFMIAPAVATLLEPALLPMARRLSGTKNRKSFSTDWSPKTVTFKEIAQHIADLDRNKPGGLVKEIVIEMQSNSGAIYRMSFDIRRSDSC